VRSSLNAYTSRAAAARSAAAHKASAYEKKNKKKNPNLACHRDTNHSDEAQLADSESGVNGGLNSTK
jgi:hypothetical protein